MSEKVLTQEITDLKQIQFELSSELVNKNKNIDHLLKENARLREALGFYANQKNYAYGIFKPTVLLDGGKLAKKALEAKSNESPS